MYSTYAFITYKYHSTCIRKMKLLLRIIFDVSVSFPLFFILPPLKLVIARENMDSGVLFFK